VLSLVRFFHRFLNWWQGGESILADEYQIVSVFAILRHVWLCGVAWRGVAWRGVAWQGVEWQGVEWQGVSISCFPLFSYLFLVLRKTDDLASIPICF
jgi:hypothetical protein